MIHVYCGTGKGKTTAAMGLALRARAAGWRVIIVQFLKDGTSGEVALLRDELGVRVIAGKVSERFAFRMSDEEQAATRGLHNCELAETLAAARAGECDLLVLDEALGALAEGLLDEQLVSEALALAGGGAEGATGSGGQGAPSGAAVVRPGSAPHPGSAPRSLELVLTGRTPPPFVEAAADYLTNMDGVRHPFDRGVAARKGVEF